MVSVCLMLYAERELKEQYKDLSKKTDTGRHTERQIDTSIT